MPGLSVFTEKAPSVFQGGVVAVRNAIVIADHATHAALNAAATTDNAVIWQQPAQTILLGVKMTLLEKFVATGMTDIDFSVGDAGSNPGILEPAAHNYTSDPVGSSSSLRGTYWDTSAEGAFWFQEAAKDWYLYATAVGANLSTLTAGTLQFQFTYMEVG